MKGFSMLLLSESLSDTWTMPTSSYNLCKQARCIEVSFPQVSVQHCLKVAQKLDFVEKEISIEHLLKLC